MEEYERLHCMVPTMIFIPHCEFVYFYTIYKVSHNKEKRRASLSPLRPPPIRPFHVCTQTASTQHSHKHMHPRTHATLTRTHAATHARNTHTHARNTHTHACMHTPVHHTTNTHSHAQVLNLHMHAHTSGPDRHIHNQVIPAHGLEPCRACVNLCLSDLLPMRTDRWDPQGTWSI